MTAFPQIDPETFKTDAEKAMAIPLGFASPLWFAYAGMASAGVAFWWMSQFAKPVNLESFSRGLDKYSIIPVPETPVVEAPIMAAEPPALPAVIPEAVTLPEPAEVVETVEAAADDLTRLVGIGPTVAAKLADLGVRTFNDIASWTADEVEQYDRSLNLMGRVKREDWVGQAKQFAAQSTH